MRLCGCAIGCQGQFAGVATVIFLTLHTSFRLARRSKRGIYCVPPHVSSGTRNIIEDTP
jgi:hypothetical protein